MRRVLLLAFIVFTLPFPAALRAEGPVRLVSGEWPPYVSASLPGFGPAAEIVREAFAATGHEVVIEFMPWKRCELMLDKGQAFAAFPYTGNDERRAVYDFSLPLFEGRDTFFYLRERLPGFAYDTLESLRPYLVGGAIGYHYEPAFTAAGLRVDYSSDIRYAFRKLLAGRVDVVIEEENVGRCILREMYPAELTRVATSATPFTTGTDHLMISRGYPGAARLSADFDAGLERLRNSGRLSAIMAAHGLKP